MKSKVPQGHFSQPSSASIAGKPLIVEELLGNRYVPLIYREFVLDYEYLVRHFLTARQVEPPPAYLYYLTLLATQRAIYHEVGEVY